nr:hypothetical protein CFP56_69694 [Quercus suber]
MGISNQNEVQAKSLIICTFYIKKNFPCKNQEQRSKNQKIQPTQGKLKEAKLPSKPTRPDPNRFSISLSILKLYRFVLISAARIVCWIFRKMEKLSQQKSRAEEQKPENPANSREIKGSKTALKTNPNRFSISLSILKLYRFVLISAAELFAGSSGKWLEIKDGVLFHQAVLLAFCQGDAYSNGGSSCSGQDYHFVQVEIGRDCDHPSYHWLTT